MKLRAKDIAKNLGITPAAVSMALNGKKGVSNETRKKVLAEAVNLGLDLHKIKKNKFGDTIYFIIYRKHGTIVSNSPFLDSLLNSIQIECKKNKYKCKIIHLSNNNVDEQLERDISTDCVGVILLATEMKNEDYYHFTKIKYPIIVLDSYTNILTCDCILINNVEGAFNATTHLINETHIQPGYLHSSYSIFNFTERANGFYNAIRNSGYAPSKSIVHKLSPTIDGAYYDMKSIIESNEELATAYFADNDLIAIGAIRAFKEAGYIIGKDISVIGFDNLPICTFIDPHLTTISVNSDYIGKITIERLKSVINDNEHYPINILINTNLIIRNSVSKIK